jgi:hypothetical protein
MVLLGPETARAKSHSLRSRDEIVEHVGNHSAA